MESFIESNADVIETFIKKAKRSIDRDTAKFGRVSAVRIDCNTDTDFFDALGCGKWLLIEVGRPKPVEQLPAWAAFQAWLETKSLKASWIFTCDSLNLRSWWDLAVSPHDSK